MAAGSILRPYWTSRIERCWTERPIVWLAGVRRIGKTTLIRQLEGVQHYNCDLPSVRRQLADPELFLEGCKADQRLAFDEIHRLDDPALLLKIAADTRPDLRLLATGSSTLAASRQFSDTLTGRKWTLRLPPVLFAEARSEFAIDDLQRRLLHGGFPDQLLAAEPDPQFFEEWIDSYFARDLQELYGLRDRGGYRRMVEWLAVQSGGLLAVTDVAKSIDLSRPTVMSYLDALEDSQAIVRLRPYHAGGGQEVTRRPKCYLFDTGLVAHLQGWSDLAGGRSGLLWEHLILDHLLATELPQSLHYWRTQGRGTDREIDFVIDRGDAGVDAIEAKIHPDAFDGRACQAFRQRYPRGRNILLTPHAQEGHRFRAGDLIVEHRGLQRQPL